MMTGQVMLALAVSAAGAAFNGYRFARKEREGSLAGWVSLGGFIINGGFVVLLLVIS